MASTEETRSASTQETKSMAAETETETEAMPTLGRAGEPCADCGAPLAADQRYCLSCGRRRGESRVDPLARETAATPPATTYAGQPAVAAGPREPSPLAAVLGIAILGAMLLVGVLIGRGDGASTATAPPSVVRVGETDGAGSESARTAETKEPAGEGSVKPVKGGGDKEPEPKPSNGNLTDPAANRGEAPVEASTEDLQALDSRSGEDYAEASQNLPDTIATPGEAPPVDNVKPGGGSGSTVIE